MPSVCVYNMVFSLPVWIVNVCVCVCVCVVYVSVRMMMCVCLVYSPIVRCTHSIAMVGGMFAGDAFKTVYFYMTGAPHQFLLCGIVQLTTDVVLLAQILTSRGQRKRYSFRED
jgi:hypothetical protein